MAGASVIGFGGGVVLEGSADTRRTDELSSCSGYDIGPRGALIATHDASDYVTVNDLATVPGPLSKLYQMRAVSGNNYVKELVVGEGLSVATLRYLMASFLRQGAASPITGATDVSIFGAPFELGVAGAIPAPTTQGVVVTAAAFPGTYDVFAPGTGVGSKVNVTLVNIGAREGYAAGAAPGLYAVLAIPPSTDLFAFAIGRFDSLGSGERGDFCRDSLGTAGTHSRQLRFRGIGGYKGYGMGWGYDSADSVSGFYEGPARLMFSNVINPLKWGNDNVGTAITPVADRKFSDSDAVSIGDGSETIRGGITWAGRFYIGTDKQMHFLAGDGRDSFLTDGANPIAKAENVIGANCLIEGPNKQLFGVGDKGLWEFDGSTFERHHQRLRDFNDSSLGWWDLIWNDPSRSDVYPGKTNADLVWMAVDWDRNQVVIGIPWCNAATGRGYGTDTMVIKFNVQTKGFTQQPFTGVLYTAGDYIRRQRQYTGANFLGTATTGISTIRKFADPIAGSTLPTPLPAVEVGDYALFGPDKNGVYRKVHLTLKWEDAVNSGVPGVWTIRATPADNDWSAAAWSPELNLFVSVAMTGVGNRVMTSPDAITWTIGVSAADNNWVSVCWSPEKLLFVAVAKSGVGNRVMTSPDGVHWTIRVSAADNNWSSVCWAKGLGLFVAVAKSGVGNRVMTSPDGVVWTLQTSAADEDWTAVCWSQSLTLLVAVAETGVGDQVMTSPDGVVWTSRAEAAARQWQSVCFSPALTLFVAVAKDFATTNLVMTSPDGVHWTSRIEASERTWLSVVWAPELAVFVAAGGAPVGLGVMTSPDGIAWGQPVTPTNNAWSALAWAPSILTMAAVADSGTGNRAMSQSVLIPAANPDLRFAITATVDGEVQDVVKLSVRPTAPVAAAVGDIWVDTSGTDTSLGNATAGVLIPASADYLVKRFYLGSWRATGVNGQKGLRITVPIAFTPKNGTRIRVAIDAELANRRWQIEDVGFDAAA